MSSEEIKEIGESLDKAWIIICGGVIFSMQCGFALLEAGSVRKKNSHVVWHKLVINCLITTLCWWLFGYAIAFGGDKEGRFVGGDHFWAGNKWQNPFGGVITQWGHFVFQVSIACVVVAITGGSISERVTLKATAIHTFVMQILIYPFIISWTWGEGWLYEHFHYKDFTGSGMVHCTGAYAGLAGLLVIGPRYNKNGNFKDVFKKEKKEHSSHQFEGPVVIQSAEELTAFRKKIVEDEFEDFGISNLSYTVFGGLILWFQFIFFNTGSSILMKSQADWEAAEKGAANTFFGGIGGGLFVLAFKHYIMHGFHTPRKLRDDAASTVNAFLGGMVANGAGMNTYLPWESFMVGVFAGIFYTAACKLFDKLKLDDALEAWQLHGACGTLGVGICAFWNHVDGIFVDNNTHGKVLGRQILGWLCISAWSFSISLVVWLACKWFGILRVDLKTEIIGYDFMDYADNVSLPSHLLEKHQGGSESVNYELAKRTSD